MSSFFELILFNFFPFVVQQFYLTHNRKKQNINDAYCHCFYHFRQTKRTNYTKYYKCNTKYNSRPFFRKTLTSISSKGLFIASIGEIAKSTPIDKTVATMYTPRLYGRYLIAIRTHKHIVLDDIRHVKAESQWYPPTYLRMNLYIKPKIITCGIIFIIRPIASIIISVHIMLIIRSSPYVYSSCSSFFYISQFNGILHSPFRKFTKHNQNLRYFFNAFGGFA